MSVPASVLEAMMNAGCSAEQIVAVAKAGETVDDEKRAKVREQNRIRQQNHRSRNASSRVTCVTERDERDTPSSPEVSPHTPLPNPSNPNPPSPPKGGSSPTDFAFAEFCEAAKGAGLPVPKTLTKDRRGKIGARISEHGPEAWSLACRKLAASGFCRGDNDRGWRADLDFLLQPKSFNRLIEGGYDDRQGTPRQSQAPPKPRTILDVFNERIAQQEQQDQDYDRTIDHQSEQPEAFGAVVHYAAFPQRR